MAENVYEGPDQAEPADVAFRAFMLPQLTAYWLGTAGLEPT